MGNTFTDASAAAGGIGLCTVAQVKSRGNITGAGSDTRIADLIDVVTRAAGIRYGREFMPRVTETRTFPLTGWRVDLGTADLVTASAVTIHPGTDSACALSAGVGYVLWPYRGDDLTGTFGSVRLSADMNLASPLASAFGFSTVEIAGTWGIWADVSDVPADIVSAAAETVLSWLSKPAAGIAGVEGDVRPVDVTAAQTWDFPASAHRKFAPYSRNTIGVW